jgi:hypothetical protein
MRYGIKSSLNVRMTFAHRVIFTSIGFINLSKGMTVSIQSLTVFGAHRKRRSVGLDKCNGLMGTPLGSILGSEIRETPVFFGANLEVSVKAQTFPTRYFIR